MEYVSAAFNKVNDRNAKRIVLHLFKHKGRELTRKEILEDLNLDIPDEKLEEKMEALVKGDIIEQGVSNYRYRAVGDNIFDKVSGSSGHRIPDTFIRRWGRRIRRLTPTASGRR